MRNIFSHLHGRDKASCARVCKHWNALLQDAEMWSEELVSVGIQKHHVWNLLSKSGWDRVGGLRLAGEWTGGAAGMWGWLRACDGLKALDISDCTIDETIASELPILTLQRFMARATIGLSDEVAAAIFASPTALRDLRLEDSTVTDAGLVALTKNTPRLENLSIRWSRYISDNGLSKVLLSCPNLTAIDLSGCGTFLTDSSLVDIAQRINIKLRSLNTTCCGALTDVGFRAIANECRNIRILALNMCRRISDEGVVQLASNCPFLEEFCLAGCRKVGDRSVAAIALHCPRLHTLDLVWCRGVTNHGILMLAKRWSSRRLRRLGLSGCGSLSDVGLARLGDGCPAMVTLDMENCISITDVGLAKLVRGCTLLRRVTLNRCSLLSDIGVKQLGLHCPHLIDLRLAGCSRVTDASVSFLLAKCLNIRRLHLTGSDEISLSAFSSLIARGGMLEELDIRGCQKISKEDTIVLSHHCEVLWS